jgi:hypothetical protein
MIQEPRYKTIAWRVFYWLFWGFIVLAATGFFHRLDHWRSRFKAALGPKMWSRTPLGLRRTPR